MRHLMFALLLALPAVAGFGAPVHAQTDPPASSFVTPFPANDTYIVQVYGDSLADGLAPALAEALADDPKISVQRKTRSLPGLTRQDFPNEVKTITEAMARDPVHIAVILIGNNDRYGLRSSGGRRQAEVGNRADEFLKLLKRRNVAIYWVSLPVMRRSDWSEDAQAINDVIRERVYLNGAKYVDIWSNYSEDGAFNQHGPDLTGRVRLLREQDGVHFTWAGSQKLAHFVEREIKRDITQARNERTIPLAGAPEDQKKLAARRQGTPPPGTTAWQGTVTPSRGAPEAGRPGAPQTRESASLPPPPGEGTGDQRADNSKVAIKAPGGDGQGELTIEIVRPAIPAAVIAHVSRTQSSVRAAQLGDPVVEDVGGGLTNLSSIAAGGGGARRGAPLTNTAYYRVLVKGERIEPRPGRADNFAWPPVEYPMPEVRAPVATAADPAPQQRTRTRSRGRSATTPRS